MPTAGATGPPFSVMPSWKNWESRSWPGSTGTNPAGGGYQGISPTILLAHKDANIAVGGGGIVSGMSPKGFFDEEGAEQLIEATRHFKQVPPGQRPHPPRRHRVFQGGVRHRNRGPGRPEEIHGHDAGLRPALLPGRRAEGARIPRTGPRLIWSPSTRSGATTSTRCWPASSTTASIMEFRPDYGPEVYTGLAKIDGFLRGVHREPPGLSGAELPGVRPLPRHRREALPPGADQDERVRHPLRPGPGPHRLVPGHLRHRRGRHRRKGRTAGSGPVPDLFHRADRCAHDLHRAAQGHGRRPLHHGRAHGQQPQRLHPGHADHRDLRHARRDRRPRPPSPDGWSRRRMPDVPCSRSSTR